MKDALDFSVLEALFQKQPSGIPQKEQTPADILQNASEVRAESHKHVYSKLLAEEREKDRQRESADKMEEVYRAHGEALRRAGILMSEITKGIMSGMDPIRLLFKACEVIGTMTGNSHFYEQNRKGLIAIYGIGLGEPIPLQEELEEVQKRLAMLTRPELEAEPEDSQRRIKAAIRFHEERAVKLEALIGT